ncbi:MAG: hypothetical protein Kow00121_47040 [Elainellaceae cyanobacterium]
MDKDSSKDSQENDIKWLQRLVIGLVVIMVAIALVLVWLGICQAIWTSSSFSVGSLDLFRSAGAVLQGIGGIGLAATAYVAIENLKGAEESRRLEAEKAEESRKAAEETRKAAEESRRVTEEKQVTDLFVKAVEMLADDRMVFRMGGIYALERLYKNSQKDYGVVMEVLAGFIRSSRSFDPELSKTLFIEECMGEIPKDIQTAMSAIARRDPKIDPKVQVDLSGADLFKVSALKGNFQSIDFTSSNLSNAKLFGCEFNDADLTSTNLSFSKLKACDFSGASLSFAELKGADLSFAILQGANLKGAKLEGANLYYADLRGARELDLNEVLLAEEWLYAKYDLPSKLRLVMLRPDVVEALDRREHGIANLLRGLLHGFEGLNREGLFTTLLKEVDIPLGTPMADRLERVFNRCFEGSEDQEGLLALVRRYSDHSFSSPTKCPF